MKLETIIQGLNVIKILGNTDVEITSITNDSREATSNSVFVAISGFQVDGHNFIDAAINNGAKVLIVEKEIGYIQGITIIIVKDTRLALARVSANFYDNPSEKLNLIGITGTNGKTSITYLIKSIFEKANKKTGLIGTIENILGNEIIGAKNTTPESIDLQKMLYNMVKDDFDFCVMEASSHSLELNRVAYSDFNIGVFTNLSPDHLDLHKNMDNYLNAKLKLFNMTKDYNIINIDDVYGQTLIKKISSIPTSILTYGVNNKADVYATNIEYYPEGVKYIAHTPKGNIPIHVNIPGLIYVYNSLAAIACAVASNISLEIIQAGIESVKGIRGRFEIVPTNKDFTVIIDYAHTGDGLEKALTTIEQFSKGRKIAVFGAGGGKGRDKRWGMGRVAAKHCDLTIVTSDNPKKENPLNIMNEIIHAIEEENGNYVAIVDRKEAIRYALTNSQPNDIILLAGKGHETTQIIGDEVIPFDEREIVIEILKEIG